MDFGSVLAAAKKIETQKEQSQLVNKLEKEAKKPAAKRFSKPKSVSRSKSSSSRKRKAPTSSIPPRIVEDKRQKPLVIPTAPIRPTTTLRSVLRITAEHITNHKGGRLLRPGSCDEKVSVWVNNVCYTAAAIHAFEEDGKLVLHLYADTTDADDVLDPPILGSTYAQVNF